ncbi:MAG: MFS transporter [Acidobacteriaceae bacterium]|nr:MFS transporter [Acidobacteriaceae bacterium]
MSQLQKHSQIPGRELRPGRAPSLEEQTRRKVSRRILPFFFALYIISYLDRANVSFAKAAMSADLGFSEAVYGFGAGIFFVGYLLLEIPGALIVERWSARLWMSRILITWGLCTILVGFARTPVQFYGARFCLGLAEAGFFPGVLVYLTHWFAPGDRARAMSSFILAVPISFVIGAPLSAFCLSLHWFGLAGWQWLFILQGLPAVFFGILTPFYLIDRPADARWLQSAERDWLSTELKREREHKRLLGHFSVRSVLGRGSVWILAAALFFVVLSSYGYILWLPSTIQRESGLSVKASTLLSALPFCAAAIMVKLMGRSSDRSGEHKLHAALPLFAAGLLFAGVAIPGQPFPLTMLWLVMTGSLLWAWAPPFWVLPTLSLGESGAAASLGLINSVGNLGGFVGPSIIGYFLANGHSYWFITLLCSGGFMISGALILLTSVPGRDRTLVNKVVDSSL